MTLVGFLIILFYSAAFILINLKITTIKHFELPERAFLTIWNAPSSQCHEFGIDLNLSMFDIIVNEKQKFVGSQVTIFYADDLGYYPKILDDGSRVNGGVPQNSNLEEHLNKVKTDISAYIPDRDFAGLSVIDWEAWRPLWVRNFDSKEPYRQLSKDLVKEHHPDYNESTVDHQARLAFENGARTFLTTTIRNAQQERPGGFWGFYGFPNCYNYKTPDNICTDEQQRLNDQLRWLFNSSSTLFPSIYLTSDLGEKYVKNTLRESQRLADRKPIYPYSRFTYHDTSQFYSKENLLNTIQLSVEMGTNGIVLWEPYGTFKSQEGCQSVKDYLDTVLGPLVLNVTTFFQNCSHDLCNLHGRCVKTTSLAGIQSLKKYNGYSCQCYKGWHGEHCAKRYG